MKLIKKEVTKYYSFGLEGIDDEWIESGEWKNYREYTNRDGLVLNTFIAGDLNDIISRMFSDSTMLGNESIVSASPDVIASIEKTSKKDKKDV